MSFVDNLTYGDILTRNRMSHGRSGAWVARQIDIPVEEYHRKEQGFESFTDSEKKAIEKLAF